MSAIDKIAEMRAKTEMVENLGTLAENMHRLGKKMDGQVSGAVQSLEKKVVSLNNCVHTLSSTADDWRKFSITLTWKLFFGVVLISVVISVTSVVALLITHHRLNPTEQQQVYEWYQNTTEQNRNEIKNWIQSQK